VITFVPLEYYALLFYYFLAVVTLFAYVQSAHVDIDDNGNLRRKNAIGVFMLVVLIFYMGLRPVSGKYFVDMFSYNRVFHAYADGGQILIEKDIVFNYFMKLCAMIMTADMFFLLCAALYIVPMYAVSKKFFGQYWFYAFLMAIGSMSFWSYGVNGIRNGIATSIFLLALSRDKRYATWLLIILATMIHKSVLIPAGAYAICLVFNNTKWILWCWFGAIPLSLAFGKSWENFFMSLGLVEYDRLEGYFGDEAAEQVVSAGFRWDFLAYSAIAVYAGWYFIKKRKFENVTYTRMYNIFLIANAFWILIIRASFSNRFAYLSWFLMGFVIIYPLLRNRFYTGQHKVIALIMLAYFILTFILNVLLKSN